MPEFSGRKGEKVEKGKINSGKGDRRISHRLYVVHDDSFRSVGGGRYRRGISVG